MFDPGLSLIGRAFVFLLFVSGTLGWGKEGHYMICKIAEGYLTEDALAAVKTLLPDYAEGDLAEVCSWADEIKHHYHWHWSSALHYVDTPDFKCNYHYCSKWLGFYCTNYARFVNKVIICKDDRDCHDSGRHKDRCVTGAIYNYTMQLTAYQDSISQSQYNLTEALMFLSHFVGDVHQPLHVGFTGDLGGNKIIVRWYHRKTNLHHVWDDMIIDSALKTFYNSEIVNMIQAIQRNITDDWPNDASSWETCSKNQTVCPDPYATESVRLACRFAYRNATPGTTLEDEYFLSRRPVVEKRLAQGGVRLAATLNRVFATKAKVAEARR